MTEGSNLQLVREALADLARAAETGQFDGWLKLFSEEIEWEAVEDAPDAGTYRGHAGIRGYLEDWVSTVDGINGEIRKMTEVGDSGVVADTRVRARVKGTDSEMSLDYSQAFWIVDGKITHIKEFREHDDALAYAEASERGSSSGATGIGPA
jgi:ketosteroid isomerase-like protein